MSKFLFATCMATKLAEEISYCKQALLVLYIDKILQCLTGLRQLPFVLEPTELHVESLPSPSLLSSPEEYPEASLLRRRSSKNKLKDEPCNLWFVYRSQRMMWRLASYVDILTVWLTSPTNICFPTSAYPQLLCPRSKFNQVPIIMLRINHPTITEAW